LLGAWADLGSGAHGDLRASQFRPLELELTATPLARGEVASRYPLPNRRGRDAASSSGLRGSDEIGGVQPPSIFVPPIEIISPVVHWAGRATPTGGLAVDWLQPNAVPP